MSSTRRNTFLIIVITVGIIAIWILWFFVYNTSNSSSERQEKQENDIASEEIIVEKTKQEVNEEIVRSKIEKIKNRLALKWLITQGDEYFRNKELGWALKSYLLAYKKNPGDEQITKKLWDTYFELNRFQAAQKYYENIRSYSWFDPDTLALTYIYGTDFSWSGSIDTLEQQIRDIQLSEQDTFYYTTSLLCLRDFHECKKTFESYTIETNELGEEFSREINSELLSEVLQAIENFKNFQVEELYFKDALITWAFYKNRNYPVAIELGKQILLEKPDYRPIIKILADSYYALGDLDTAKTYLADFYKLDDSDPGVAYLLWVIHGNENDQVLSNIYLNKALENGYNPTINIRRQLVHNFFTLDSEENIINAFYDLIEQENDYDKSDLELAIYYYILYAQYDQAKIWIEQWFERYPTEENFHWYLGWIQRETGQTDKAKQEFQKGLDINPKNPFLLYNIALLEKEIWNSQTSLIYLKQIKKFAPESEFAKQAEIQIQDLSKK